LGRVFCAKGHCGTGSTLVERLKEGQKIDKSEQKEEVVTEQHFTAKGRGCGRKGG